MSDPARPPDGLDSILIGGRERRAIVIVAYDPAWPERFAAERARIEQALGPARGGPDAERRIEHVGSTSVPGLAAKPIIDMLITVADADDEPEFVPALERAGYRLRVREPGHRMLRTPELDVHVHVLAASDPEAGRMLRFRDQLRADPQLRAAYAQLKRGLAQRTWADMNAYADAKSPFIEAALADE